MASCHFVKEGRNTLMTEVSDDQRRRWREAFRENPALFGEKPGDAAGQQ